MRSLWRRSLPNNHPPGADNDLNDLFNIFFSGPEVDDTGAKAVFTIDDRIGQKHLAAALQLIQ